MSKSIYAGLALIAVSGASAANADSFKNMSQAVGDSAEASSRVIAAGGQVTLGAIAVPLSAIGAISEATGEAATAISGDLWDVANAPLTISDEVVIAQAVPTVPRTPAQTRDEDN